MWFDSRTKGFYWQQVIGNLIKQQHPVQRTGCCCFIIELLFFGYKIQPEEKVFSPEPAFML